MNRLETNHIDFLRKCASQPNRIHGSDLPPEDLAQMTNEGLLLSYNKPSGMMYCITHAGGLVAKSYGESPDLIDIAVKYVISKGYEEEAARKIVSDNGAEHILKSMAAEQKEGGTGQREVTLPMSETGVPQIKFRG